MSATVKKLPFGTRTTVIDHLFQAEHDLSYSEMIVMCYLVLASKWADQIAGYSLLLVTKVNDDLYSLGSKTIESAFTKLKKLELIDTKRATVEKWSHTQKYRTVLITDMGKKYNLSYHKPKEYEYVGILENEIEEYKAKNEFMHLEKSKLEEENFTLTMRLKSTNMLLDSQENMNQKSLEIFKNEDDLYKKINTLELKLEEARAIIQANKEEKKKHETSSNQETNSNDKEEEVKKIKNIDIFRKKIIKEFSNSANILCNGVPKWNHNVEF